MTSMCATCLKQIKTKSKVECCDCLKNFHLKCVNLTAVDVQFLDENNEPYRCNDCQKVKRKSMVLESKSNITYDDVLSLFHDLKNEFSRVEKSLGGSLSMCHDDVKDLKLVIEEQKKEISKLVSSCDDLARENVSLKKHIGILEVRLDESEQYSRRNTIEIHGIPTEPNENVLEVVKKVGQSLNYPIETNMVDACHRLRNNQNGNRPPGIIVKMVRRLDAEGLLARRRVKRNLNTSDLGYNLPQSNPVYINESLSPSRRKLFLAARTIKNEKAYTYLWVRGGKIFMRKEDKMPVKVIGSAEDLEKL